MAIILEMLESRKTLQGDGGNFHSIPKKDENSCPTRENDDLILGIREKVTKFYFLFALLAIILVIFVCPVLTVRAWPLIICWYTCLMLIVIFTES
jgi:Flp pilus assembly protein TadB